MGGDGEKKNFINLISTRRWGEGRRRKKNLDRESIGREKSKYGLFLENRESRLLFLGNMKTREKQRGGRMDII
jgi:hypothetical protein